MIPTSMSHTPDNDALNNKKRSGIFRFFANHPAVGIISAIVGVVSLIVTVYFHMQDTKYRELAYYVSPAKAVVVGAGESSNLRVYMGDQMLQSDVTAAQIQIWNQGKEPIKPGDLLAPLTIRTNPSVPILEATIRKRSRDVVRLSLDREHLKDGVITVSWNILERGDGGVIQLIYAGGPSIEVTASSVIVGQRAIHQIQYTGKIKSPLEQMRIQRQNLYFFWATPLIGFFFFLDSANWLRRKLPILRSRDLRRYRIWYVLISARILLAVVAIVMIGVSIYLIRTMSLPSPPFGF